MKWALLVASVSVILAGAVTANSAQISPKPAVTPSKLTDKATGMEFVLVKGGCYRMGDTVADGAEDEKPAHDVCVKDFYLGKYEVTQGQWEKVMGANPSGFKECGKDCPVEFVSWDMVQEFIQKLNASSKRNYRLPTEAEWEYAARGGGKADKWAGTSNEAELPDYAWFGDNSEKMTHKVGQKKPNGLGLYDMTGNVREWCLDWYDENYYGKSPKNDPQGGDGQDGRRVLRGGDWERLANGIKNSTRNGNAPDLQTTLYGFRLLLPVMVVPAK